MGGVAVEVWTMQGGLQFDNFYVGHDEAAAKAFGEATWAKKSAFEAQFSRDAAAKIKREERERMKKEGRQHLRFMARIYQMQINHGCYFLHEHPESFGSWDEPCIKELVSRQDAKTATAVQCPYGSSKANNLHEQLVGHDQSPAGPLPWHACPPNAYGWPG